MLKPYPIVGCALRNPPPAFPPHLTVRHDCGPARDFCFDRPDEAALLAWIGSSRKWQDEIYERCRVPLDH